MTNDFGDPNTPWERERGDEDFFDATAAQGHLLIVRIHDVAQYFRTKNNPDGQVWPKKGADGSQPPPFPNSVVRCSVVDMNVPGEDGLLGRIYPEAIIFPSSLTKPLKTQVGKLRLMMWQKVASNPKYGVQLNDPYQITNMAGNEQAVAAAQDFLARHPEFNEIPAPEPYDGQPPQPVQPQYQQGPPPQWQQQGPPPGWNPGYQQGPPPGQWQGQGYPPAQPQYGPPQPPYQQDPWASQVPQQTYGPQGGWQQPGPPQSGQWQNQPGQAWEQQHRQQQQQQYQQGPPPQQGQQPPQGSFLDRSAGQNHWGQPQDGPPPF